MAYMTDYARPFVETWEAYKKPVPLDRISDTDNWRIGWPKPTIHREHEAIHILANHLDIALSVLTDLEARVKARVEFYNEEYTKDGHDITRGRADEAQAILNIIQGTA